MRLEDLGYNEAGEPVSVGASVAAEDVLWAEAVATVLEKDAGWSYAEAFGSASNILAVLAPLRDAERQQARQEARDEVRRQIIASGLASEPVLWLLRRAAGGVS